MDPNFVFGITDLSKMLRRSFGAAADAVPQLLLVQDPKLTGQCGEGDFERVITDYRSLFDVGGFYRNVGYSQSHHLPPDRSPQFLRFLAAEMGHKLKCELSCLTR